MPRRKKSSNESMNDDSVGLVGHVDTSNPIGVSPSTSSQVMNSLLEVDNIPEVIPRYHVELSKSCRAECKKCDQKIQKNVLRVGVITEGGNWGLFTRWQHIGCTVFHKTVTDTSSLEGYNDLSIEHQEIIKQRVIDSLKEIDSDVQPVDPDELVRKEWSEAKEASDDLLISLLPYQKEGLGWMSHQEQTEVRGGILADE